MKVEHVTDSTAPLFQQSKRESLIAGDLHDLTPEPGMSCVVVRSCAWQLEMIIVTNQQKIKQIIY